MVKAEREWRVRAAFQHPLLAKNVAESSGSVVIEETRKLAVMSLKSICVYYRIRVVQEPSINPCSTCHVRDRDDRDKVKCKADWSHLQPIIAKPPACFSNHESKMGSKDEALAWAKMNSCKRRGR